jgi:SAM-dependent methyltransferase
MQHQHVESVYYTEKFFASSQTGCRRSAEEIVPLVMKMIPCSSVVDVGCGMGTWLRVFEEHGVSDVTGFDGEYIDRNVIEINATNFYAMDLSSPPKWSRTFDLAMSLEVAEHLPADASNNFVSFLASLAPAILFSAAVPGQGGTNHVNEQWPDYWVDRFKKHGFAVLDVFREAIWTNQNVEYWYAQNTFLFLHQDVLSRNLILQDLAARTRPNLFRLVHPGTLNEVTQQLHALRAEMDRLAPHNLPVSALLRLLPGAVMRALKRRVRSRKRWIKRDSQIEAALN